MPPTSNGNLQTLELGIVSLYFLHYATNIILVEIFWNRRNFNLDVCLLLICVIQYPGALAPWRIGCIACKTSKRLIPCVVYRTTERRIRFAYTVAMILQLSCLTHAESIDDVWDKPDAPGPLGDRLSCFESVYH